MLDALGHRLGIALEQQLAGVQDQHFRAIFRFVQIGRGPDDADAIGGQRVHHAPQFTPGDRVDADARLVEQKQARRAQHGAGEAQLLLHAARKPPREPADETGKIGEGKQPLEALVARFAHHATQIGVQRQVFEHGEVFVEAEALRHVADGVMQAQRVLDRVEAADRGLAASWRQKPRQQPHERGFARAVRPDDAGYLSRADRKAQRIERGRRIRGEALGQVLNDRERLLHGQFLLATGVPSFAGGSVTTVTGMPWRKKPVSSSTTMRSR